MKISILEMSMCVPSLLQMRMCSMLSYMADIAAKSVGVCLLRYVHLGHDQDSHKTNDTQTNMHTCSASNISVGGRWSC
jgi:hypothetical protein